jgi:transcriptional regulator with XRE-family HTH domain
LGLTQEDLAKMMGYKSKSTINKIELGINDIPQSKIVQFAEVLGTTPAELMGWKEDDKNISPSETSLTEGEQMWLELYHRLSEDARKSLIETMSSFDSLPKDKQQLALQLLRVALGGHE